MFEPSAQIRQAAEWRQHLNKLNNENHPYREQVLFHYATLKVVVYRVTKLTEHDESTSTWFGLTEVHDRGTFLPLKFLKNMWHRALE